MVKDGRLASRGERLMEALSEQEHRAADAIERCIGTRPVAVRSGGSLPLFQTLCDRGIPVICTGFGIEREANMHGPNERFPEDHLERGTEAMLQILGSLEEHP